MTPATIVWIHALTALAFAIVALRETKQRAGGGGRIAFIAALGATALWALAVSGIEPADLVTRVAEGVLNLAWLVFMATLSFRERRAPHRSAVITLYVVLGLLTVVGMGVAGIEASAGARHLAHAAADVRQTIRMMTAAGALILVHRLVIQSRGVQRGGVRLVAIALGILWGTDLLYALAIYAGGPPSTMIVALRGALMLLIAPLFGIAANRGGDWTLQLSRTMAMRWAVAGGVLIYVAVIGFGTAILGSVAGANAPLAQTAFVCGMTVAILTLASNPWLNAWLKVVIAKHFYRHRYDYRDEWLRFTDTIGAPEAGKATLEARVTKAVADLTDSPAALLLTPDDGGLGVAARWNCTSDCAGAAGSDFAEYLARTARIIALDAVRAGEAPADEHIVVPSWAIDQQDAWAIVPLLHFGALAGAIVLARPPVDRALDWEDFDLLGLAGRQVASYLAEDRAHARLADAERFDEFNRRFAFIMHDLKNLVSQLTLVARNAERHAENPAFRADMIATLKDSADRMNGLLARLSQHHGGSGSVPERIDVAVLCNRIAESRRAQHPVAAAGQGEALAFADVGALEVLLGHLVQNAIEASAPTDAVMLVVGEDEGRVTIDIIDRGSGMDAVFVREQLFKPFSSTKPGGFGIGAFEARQLAEAMGGKVTVASREGEGTRFRVTLPMARDEKAAA
ncbi:Histidine kinase [Sphingomonas sp. EC-HK361]|uniref:XrtA/PEP-CTERM system histidine kinase PrsK n=1 Tax=Sphingomonas sp. EC-HK361 TaxID=2038397 RepID=UPI00125B28B7|nr:XrtA/PEP-CTERM system histidine kinase PrsK [Sphingomonas sp. EC-HK361]VVT08115.1 Histidine kinase [Sphingomonas sp. EC-HK361]